MVIGMIKRGIGTLKNIESCALRVMSYGLIYGIVILIICLIIAVMNLANGVDIEILKNNMLLTESGITMFPLSIGAGLLLDYCLKKQG